MTSWWPGLPDVSETRLRPSPTSNPPAGQACQPSPPSLRPKLVGQVCLPCLRQAGQAQIIQQAQPRLKLCQPETSLRCLRLAQPSQLATQPQAQVCMKQALPTRPSTAQPRPSSRHNQQPGPAARQPATHHGFAASWLRLASGPAQSLPSPASQGTTSPQLPASGQRLVSRV